MYLNYKQSNCLKLSFLVLSNFLRLINIKSLSFLIHFEYNIIIKRKTMQPSSFQYQPLNIQRGFNKIPNFLNNKILDKSAPNLNPTRPLTFNSTLGNKQSQKNHNKSTYIPSNKDLNNGSYTPKSFMEKNNNLNNLSSPALKFYSSPTSNKHQQRHDRNNRGETSRSLVIQQSQANQGPSFTQMSKKISDPMKYSPQRRAPRMSQGYQPYQNNFMLQSYPNPNNVQSPGMHKQKQSNFMKVKNAQQSRQKKLIVPSFLARNVSDMKRSSIQIFNSNSQSSQKKLATSTSSLFNDSKSRKKVSSSDYQKIKQLGNGKYGRVYLVRQKSTGFICALKVIQKKLLIEQQITEQFIRELKIQMYLNHPNIIKMYGYFDDQKNIYIILEVGTGGQLYHHLKKSQSLPQARVAFLMKQICDAVNQIHSLRIIHRDIKPENIVLHDNIIKLCDFGWSVHQDNKLRTTFCGTPLYVCPQILRGKQYDQKIDIWSLGIMMYEMVVGQNPFKITKQEQLIKIVKDEIKIPSYVYVSSEVRDFLDKCLQKNPADRVTIKQLINHPFFKKHQQKEKKSFNL